MSRLSEMQLEIARCNVAPEDGTNNNIFVVKYDRGSLTIDLRQLLPCAEADFRRLCAFVDKIPGYTEQEAVVSFLWRYVSAMDQELSRIKETYSENDTKSRAECQRHINKFDKYLEIMRKSYAGMIPDGENASPTVKRQRMKTADVYTVQTNTETGEPKIKMFPGKLYTAPDGVIYGIYSAGKGYYHIIDIYSGLSCGDSHTPAECAERLTGDYLKRLAELRQKENYLDFVRRYVDLMTAAGYAENITPFPSDQAPEEPQNQPAPEPVKKTETAPEEPKTPEERPEKPHNNVIPRDCIAVHCVMHYGETVAEMLIKAHDEYGRKEWIYTDNAGNEYSVFIQHIRNAELCEIVHIYRAGDIVPASLYEEPETVEPGPDAAKTETETPAATTPAEITPEPYPEAVETEYNYQVLEDRYLYRLAFLAVYSGGPERFPAYHDALRVFAHNLTETDKKRLYTLERRLKQSITAPEECAAFIMALVDVSNAAPDYKPTFEQLRDFDAVLVDAAAVLCPYVYLDIVSDHGLTYYGAQAARIARKVRCNRIRIYLTADPLETPQYLHNNADLVRFIREYVLAVQNPEYLNEYQRTIYNNIRAYLDTLPEPPEPKETAPERCQIDQTTPPGTSCGPHTTKRRTGLYKSATGCYATYKRREAMPGDHATRGRLYAGDIHITPGNYARISSAGALPRAQFRDKSPPDYIVPGPLVLPDKTRRSVTAG